MVLTMVISGGQTGVDQVGLLVAETLRYRTGGTAPKGFRTDDGPAPWLGTRYGLKESPSSGYHNRTIDNVRDSEMTVWFGDERSPGGILTKGTAKRLQRFWLPNPDAVLLRDWLEEWNIRILNVAGNRLRTNPAATERARAILTEVLMRADASPQ